jgi:peptidyl-tRNA hydrolase, PTH1 family
MKLIVGLGNPGRQYERTRHNLGFRVADLLALRWSVPLAVKGICAFGRGSIAGTSAALLKPMAFMNRSGQAVLETVQFYKLPLSDVLVVFDDLDLPVGRVRMRTNGSAGGHKGLGDIIQRLGSDEIARVRIGIGRPVGAETVDYVLSPFRPEEQTPIEEALLRSAQAAECWLTDGPVVAMNRYNRNQDSQSEPE